MEPRLNRTDAWMIGALTETRRGAEPMRLRAFVNNADWLNRAIPTFDDVSFSFARLLARGYLRLSHDRHGKLMVKGSEAAFDLRDRVQDHTLGGVLADLAAMVDAQPYPLAEVEDRSLGRLPDFEPSEWETAVAANAAWMARATRPIVAAVWLAQALGLLIALPTRKLLRLLRSRRRRSLFPHDIPQR